jgi:cyclic pyranopterin phosphate synthase
MPMGKTPLDRTRQLFGDEIKKRLQAVGELTPVDRGAYDGPAESFRFPGSSGRIGIIRPITQHFCGDCNRLRLTASGQIRPCLLSDIQIDIRNAVRGQVGDREIKQTLMKAVSSKPDMHHLNGDKPIAIKDQMTAIGG